MNTDRTNDLTKALSLLIANRDLVANSLIDLTEDDKENILGPLGDAISDCEYMLREARDDDAPDTMERGERAAYLGNVL